MGNLPRASRTPAVISELLQQKLNAYALAAGAAGVSVLALAPPAEARIVYTPAHVVIRDNGTYSIDLNQDGTVDFLIHDPNGALYAKAAYGNAIRVQLRWPYPARALKFGTEIGPKKIFTNKGLYGQVMLEIERSSSGSTTAVVGFWYNVKKRYLGLRFLIGEETHYGWARLNVSFRDREITGTLTGYAYETIADKALTAGDEGNVASEGDLSQSEAMAKGPKLSRPASLGGLALGSRNLRERRRP